jgi:hypothetical protein
VRFASAAWRRQAARLFAGTAALAPGLAQPEPSAQPAAALQPAVPDAAVGRRREARGVAEALQPEEAVAQDAAAALRQEAAAVRAEGLRQAAAVPDVAVPPREVPDVVVLLRVAPDVRAGLRPLVAVCHRDRPDSPVPSPAARFPRAMTGWRIASP